MSVCGHERELGVLQLGPSARCLVTIERALCPRAVTCQAIHGPRSALEVTSSVRLSGHPRLKPWLAWKAETLEHC